MKRKANTNIDPTPTKRLATGDNEVKSLFDGKEDILYTVAYNIPTKTFTVKLPKFSNTLEATVTVIEGGVQIICDPLFISFAKEKVGFGYNFIDRTPKLIPDPPKYSDGYLAGLVDDIIRGAEKEKFGPFINRVYDKVKKRIVKPEAILQIRRRSFEALCREFVEKFPNNLQKYLRLVPEYGYQLVEAINGEKDEIYKLILDIRENGVCTCKAGAVGDSTNAMFLLKRALGTAKSGVTVDFFENEVFADFKNSDGRNSELVHRLEQLVNEAYREYYRGVHTMGVYHLLPKGTKLDSEQYYQHVVTNYVEVAKTKVMFMLEVFSKLRENDIMDLYTDNTLNYVPEETEAWADIEEMLVNIKSAYE